MISLRIYIIALAAHGQGISGSDRIFIEFAKVWSRRNSVTIYVWEEGFKMCQRQHLEISNISKASLLQKQNVKYQISNMGIWRKFGFVINYLARIIEGIRLGFSIRLENSPSIIVYSASEFWMDSIPALILKLRYSKIKWVAAWFQTAPKPWVGFTEGERSNTYKLSAFLYWLAQLPIKPVISHFADFILVNNEQERKQFPILNKKNRVIVVLGAVDLTQINQWKKKFKNLPKIYDAVFQGRFHPQKGVVELIDIWKLVVNKKNDAKLALIGEGPLMEDVKQKINQLMLQKNIKLFGYVFDGPKKYKIFAQSKLVVHPAFYDSGGMAAAEAMAFGIPAIGFNLPAYKSYYPKGMYKVPVNNLMVFADTILNLLDNKKLYLELGDESKQMISKNWSWDKRANEVLARLS
ncbi:MAG: glycosyltransferase [Candidatus Daviesbacteria bacterium]|nr:glycosyltransferase [Candidatus Daviesbacteria bacterium]